MYAGKEKSVPLPTKGHLHITKQGYVYWEDDGRWDNVLKRPVDSRRSIGKIDPDDTARFYPNAKCQEILGECPEPGPVGNVLTIGPYIALKAAARKCGCLDVLEEVFPWEQDRVFAVAMHSICTGGSVAQDFPFWCFSNYCGLEKPLSSQEVGQLFDRVATSSKRIGDFLRGYRAAYEARIPGPRIRCVAFDSTSQSTTSDGMAMAAHGHPKQNPGVPQINTALFVDEATAIPLFYEHFIGSIVDKAETPFTIEKARSLGCQKLFAAMDRGYFSKDVADAFSELEFSINAPDNATIVRTMIDGHGRQILFNEEFYLGAERAYGIHLADMHVLGGTYDAYLFYDDGRAQRERDAIHNKVDAMVAAVLRKKRYTDALRKKYGRWLDITKVEEKDEAGRNFLVSRNTPQVQREIGDAGYFVVVSNGGLDAGPMLHVVRGRDQGEKVFQRLKSHLGLTSPYTHNMHTYEGKMFVAFVALVIVQSLRWFLHELIAQPSTETLRTVLRQLETCQIQRKEDGSWMPCYALTRKQKDIFAALDLAPDEVVAHMRAVKGIV